MGRIVYIVCSSDKKRRWTTISLAERASNITPTIVRLPTLPKLKVVILIKVNLCHRKYKQYKLEDLLSLKPLYCL